MKKISLTQGKFALVDNEDFEVLNKSSWYAIRKRDNWYARRTVKGNDKEYMHHALIPCKPGTEIHHLNDNGLDNRRTNIELLTQSEHAFKHIRDRYGPHPGVTFRKNRQKWRARIVINRVEFSLGHFNTKEEAIIARQNAEKTGIESGILL